MKRSSVSLYVNIIAIIFLISYLFFNTYSCSKLPVEHKVVTAKDGVITIPVGEVNDGKVHFFTYKKSGKRINFFIKTSGSRKISAYFDACYICYKKKKGYRIEGTALVCNECNLRFSLKDEIWENKDCSPILIKSKIENDNIIINANDLEKGGKLF